MSHFYSLPRAEAEHLEHAALHFAAAMHPSATAAGLAAGHTATTAYARLLLTLATSARRAGEWDGAYTLLLASWQCVVGELDADLCDAVRAETAHLIAVAFADEWAWNDGFITYHVGHAHALLARIDRERHEVRP